MAPQSISPLIPVQVPSTVVPSQTLLNRALYPRRAVGIDMGWWKTKDGVGVVGDEPLDALGGAVTKIVGQYQGALGRQHLGHL